MSILSSLLNLGQGQPTQQIPQTVQTTEIAKEVAPFIKDILGKGQALYKQRMDEGYVPYEGQTLAEMSPDQLAAEEGLRGLVGSQAANIAEARGLTRGQTDAPTIENLQSFMNPYQQAVTDIAKRQATEQFEQTTLPTLRKQAVDAGSFGGSRAAMLESQAQDNQARLLADLQAKGDLAAFQNAQKAFADQKERERLAAEGLTSLSGIEDTAARRELAGLQAVGVTQQKREQQLLDEAYKKFLDERKFPEQQLGQYQGFVQGASPFLGKTSTTMTPQTYQPSPIERALTFGTTALGTAQQAKNLFSKEGGGIKQGLASLPVVQRADAGIIMDESAQRRRPPMIEDEEDIGGKSRGEKFADRFKQVNEIEPREEGEQSQGENLADSFKSFLKSLGINTGQPKQEIEQEDISTPIIKKTDPDNIPPGFIEEGEFGGKSDYVDPRALDDTIASQVKPDEPKKEVKSKSEVKDDSIRIPGVKDAIKLQSTNISDFQKAIDERKTARLNNIQASKDALKAQAKVDFLMGFGRGKRDPRDGSFLGGLTAMGQSAVDATKDFEKDIMALDREELAVLDKNVKDQFDLETQRINLAFKKGEIDREQRDYLLEEKKVKYLGITAGIDRAKDSATFAISIINNDDLSPGQKRKFLDDALANNVISLQDYRNALTNPDALKKNTGDDPIDLNKKVPITVNPN